MQSTYISPVPRALVQRVDTRSRLNWLLAVNDYEARRRRLFRNAFEEEQVLMMQRAFNFESAYALFGLLLGAAASGAILYRLFGYGFGGGTTHMVPDGGALLFLCVVINVVCALVGYWMGSAISRNAIGLEEDSWSRMLVLMPILGAGWGGVTGVSGGFFFLGFGAFTGCFIGMLVGSVGFLIFAMLHRTLKRGGMIESRHLLPIACGIAAIFAAAVLGLEN